MTAVALLFAIYMVRPSPFCILDEVDAPLDEGNINRFIRVLERFVAQSQFIIMTHNKRTISEGGCALRNYNGGARREQARWDEIDRAAASFDGSGVERTRTRSGSAPFPISQSPEAKRSLAATR